MNILSLISKSKGVQGFNREYKIIAEDNGGVYKGVLNSMKEAWTSNPLFVVFHGKQKIIYNKSEIKALSLLDKAELFDKIMGIKEGDNVLLFTKTDRIEKINYNIIKLEVESYFKLKEDSILIKTRKREVVQCRQIAMYFAMKLIKRTSLEKVGQQYGDKDHATVLHACKTVNNLIETNREFRMYIEYLDNKFKNNYLPDE